MTSEVRKALTRQSGALVQSSHRSNAKRANGNSLSSAASISSIKAEAIANCAGNRDAAFCARASPPLMATHRLSNHGMR